MTVAAPTDIWIGYEPRRWAQPMHASMARWMCLVLHRRAGKTVATVNHLIRAATDDQREAQRLTALEPALTTTTQLESLLRDRFYGHVLPTYKQAEVTAWQMIRHYTAKIPGVTHNEQKLRTVFPNGARLQLFGADKPDSLRGIGFSGIAFDEYSQHPPTIFGEVISKALADHLGFAIFLGTIKGQNQLYKAYHAGKDDAAWFTVWQDIDQSLRTEEDATTLLLKQAVQDDYALIDKGLMSREEFDQEWYLSTDAAIRGAYYTKQISLARKDGRVTTVPYEPALPVDTNWDIGITGWALPSSTPAPNTATARSTQPRLDALRRNGRPFMRCASYWPPAVSVGRSSSSKPQSGQPTTVSPTLIPSLSRRPASSSWNCSSVR